MTPTIRLFTEPFTVGNKTWPPLVERVREVGIIKTDFIDQGYMPYIGEALLIRAAHEWAVNQQTAVVERAMVHHMFLEYGGTVRVETLVHACHLIADSLRSTPAGNAMEAADA